MIIRIYTAVLGSFAEISPLGLRPSGDISAKLPRTAVYIVYSPHNHDLYYTYIYIYIYIYIYLYVHNYISSIHVVLEK